MGVIELLDALEGEGLAAEGEPDAQDGGHAVRRVVIEVGLAPLEDFEEQLAGELLDAEREAVEGVVAHLEDQARQVLLGRHVAGQQLVERRRGQRPAPEQVDAQPVARKGAGDVDDLAVLPVQGAAVVAARDQEPARPPVQLHPLEEVREAEDLETSPEVFCHWRLREF